MIQNYNFNKNIRKIDNNYALEILLPNDFSIIKYKIYGSDNFYHHGTYTISKNIKTNNILIIIIDKLQNLFINILINETIEYFDFYNMYKNINIDIKKVIKNNDICLYNEEEKNNILSEDLFNYFKKNSTENVESSSDEDDEEDDEDSEIIE
jgi:hypothetical protein